MPKAGVDTETQVSQKKGRGQTGLSHSFVRAVGNGLRCHKLGSLLKASGLITPKELNEALVIHDETGEPLGKILVRQGVVSAVQVYRKLAEQWCLKASTAGIAMMMQTMTPVAPAQAAESNITPQFQLASAAAQAPYIPKAAKAASYPKLFGAREIRSDDITPFTKWTSVMARFEDQMSTRSSTPRVMMWRQEMQSLRGQSVRAQLKGVNDYINQTRYIEDKDNWQKSDYWATPAEFFARGGDCEDFAIAKYASLRALGYRADQLRVAIVRDTVKAIHHAVLIVYTDNGVFVLDNQNKSVKAAEKVSRYQPIFSINSSSWWLHKAGKPTV